jgi:acetylornithine deacetylase
MACTVDEEFTHVGSSHLAANETGADLAIVAEPTRLDLVNCHKGAIRWKVRARGVACHSSTPDLGINAIYRMAELVRALAAHADDLAQSAPHPVLGPPSLSVGRIEGGQSVNVVPDWCEVEVDRRIIPGEVATQCLTRARDALIERLGGGAEGWFEFLPPWVNMPALTPSEAGADEWVGVVRRAIAEAIGRTPEVTGVPYGTDAGPLGAAGLPCLVFGPGDIAQAHTKDEWIELDQVGAAVDAYYQIACALGE